MSGAPGDHRWCTAIRGSKPAFTLATRDVVGDAVEISLYSDAGCNKPFAANITFDGCIAGPREVRGTRGSEGEKPQNATPIIYLNVKFADFTTTR